MNLTLIRQEYLIDGVFSVLQDESGEFEVNTLEHSYARNDGWEPKIPLGVFECKRGKHRIHTEEIETFEVTGIPGTPRKTARVVSFSGLSAKDAPSPTVATPSTSSWNSKPAVIVLCS